MASRVPSGLRIIALRKVVESIDMHVENISWQPHELKDNILYLLSKRGRITDDNIGKVSQVFTRLEFRPKNSLQEDRH